MSHYGTQIQTLHSHQHSICVTRTRKLWVGRVYNAHSSSKPVLLLWAVLFLRRTRINTGGCAGTESVVWVRSLGSAPPLCSACAYTSLRKATAQANPSFILHKKSHVHTAISEPLPSISAVRFLKSNTRVTYISHCDLHKLNAEQCLRNCANSNKTFCSFFHLPIAVEFF